MPRRSLAIHLASHRARVPADHTIRIELTNLDSPYITPSRIPSVTTISNVSVEIPIR